MESPSPIEIISIDVPDTVLRKNIQNATNVACVVGRHGGLEEAREKFINALVAENGNAKPSVTTAKAAYPGLAKQIIATETGESQILDEVGFVDDDRRIRKVVRVQPRACQLDEVYPNRVATSSKHEAIAKGSTFAYAKANDNVKSSDNVLEVGLNSGRDLDRKPSISPSAVLDTLSVVDNGGRHECALSDFSVDKEDYKLTRYGLDAAAEDEIQEKRKDRHSGVEGERSNDSIEGRRVIPLDEHVDREESKDTVIVDQGGFPIDDVRCPNTQVLVLLSAMIHNPFEKDGATLIVEENGAPGKGEITIYKGDSDGSIDKLSVLVQSPVPSSQSDESTVKIQEIVEEGSENGNEAASDDSLIMDRTCSSKRDASLEIDGKYVKSVVNARKSPRRTRNGQLRVYENENENVNENADTVDNVDRMEKKSADSATQSDETFYKTVSLSSSKGPSRARSPRKERRSRSSVQKATIFSESRDFATISDEIGKRGRRHEVALKGSLDSMIGSNDTRTIARRRSRADETFSKKSKSYESIKKTPEVFYEDPSKADSTSQLITSNELDTQVDEFCSVCCYVNEMSLRTEEGAVSPVQENFYTLRSNCSSMADEDSTECDICSSWNLQESSDGLDRKNIAGDECDQLCEVCDICSEICATFNPDQDTRSFSTREKKMLESSTLSLPRDACRITDSAATDPSLDEDSFEIENCGVQGGLSVERDTETGSKSLHLSDASVAKKKSRDKYFVPKDELAILSSGSKRMNRKGSLLRRRPLEDPVNVAQDKRRYSSVDSLQPSRTSARSNDKVVRSRNGKLIGSADNIRASRSSRRCKSLQRSADNVRYADSSTDNLDSLAESLDREEETGLDLDDRREALKVRDNETVKMILTKHGIKIISDKETVL